MPINRLLGCALILSCLGACSAEAVGGSKPRAAPVASVPPNPELARLPLGERLRREATGHPDARAQIDHWLRDLAHEGVELVRTRQVLAAPLGADYCATALSTHGLGLSLCAFADATRAEEGLQRSRAGFDRLIPGRTLLRSGAALLTLTGPAGAEAGAESQRVAKRFSDPHQGGRASL